METKSHKELDGPSVNCSALMRESLPKKPIRVKVTDSCPSLPEPDTLDKPIDAQWAEHIQRAKEVREQSRKARKGKPLTSQFPRTSSYFPNE